MEKVNLIDSNGNPTGKVETRTKVHQEGLPHCASGIIIYRIKNGQYEILSQQRSKLKEKNAGLWDISASGHVPYNETPKTSLLREIKEELGLNINEDKIEFLGQFWQNRIYKKDFIENELDYIYLLEENIDTNTIKIQKKEVEQVKYFNLKTFQNLIKNKKAVSRDNIWGATFKYFETRYSL